MVFSVLVTEPFTERDPSPQGLGGQIGSSNKDEQWYTARALKAM